ncbi:unnamed protein product [Ixodes hexagonus]
MDAGRPTYESKSHQLLTLAALLVGKNAIFKFPCLLFAYGGVPFFFAYTIFTVSVVIPIMHLENTLGQFSGSGNLGIFDTSPVFRVASPFLPLPFFTTGWFVRGKECSSNVFLTNLMDASCRPGLHVRVHSRAACLSTLRVDYQASYYAAEQQLDSHADVHQQFFIRVPSTCELCLNRTRVLRINSAARDVNSIHPEMAVTTAVLWLTTYGLIRNGVHKNRYIMYAIVAFSTLSLLVLVGTSLTLVGSDLGIWLLLRCPISSFFNYKLWRDALMLSVSHMGIFGSAFLNVVRFNTFKNNLKW